MRLRAAAIALIVGSALAGPSIAQTAAGGNAGPDAASDAPRCRLAGQMAVSNWLELLGLLTRATPDVIDPALARLDATTSLYGAIGCDGDRLAVAFDCLLAADGGTAAPAQRARACLIEAGLAETE